MSATPSAAQATATDFLFDNEELQALAGEALLRRAWRHATITNLVAFVQREPHLIDLLKQVLPERYVYRTGVLSHTPSLHANLVFVRLIGICRS